MTRFIHICASQNDLFALDADGNIYQYHFNVKTWVRLSANRGSEEDMSSDGAWRPSTRPQDGEGRVGEGNGYGVLSHSGRMGYGGDRPKHG